MLAAVGCIAFLAILTNAKPDLFEGDIVLNEKTRKIVESKNVFDAVANAAKKWPNGVVPYVFDRYFDQYRRSVVHAAIQDFNKHTCVRFKPRNQEKNYVRFMIGQGCSSQIGVYGWGMQDISIGNGCQYKGIVIHEMMHAVGFWHAQSRLDRDQYVTIYWQNIQKDMDYNFQMYKSHEASYYGEPYDYDSIMHYENNAFSVNGYSTIVAKGNPNKVLGQRVGFSPTDIKQINKLYGCSGTGTGGTGSCTDSDTNCAAWAANGECQKNPDWMKVNCKKSCNTCVSASCVDNHADCQSWQSIGECSKNPDYMLVNCKKSCKQC